MFSLYYILALCLFSLSVNADIVCPATPPSATACPDCQNAISSIFPANYFKEFDPNNLPTFVHPCDIYNLWFVELLRHWSPEKSAFDPDVPQLVKDSITTACTLSTNCTAEFALPEAKTIENGCGDLVAASGNDTGVNDARIADVILYGGVPQRDVYCTNDTNGDSFGFDILGSILEDAKTKATPDQIYIHAPNHPILEYYLVSNTTHEPTVQQLPVSAICTPAYAFMVTTYTKFVAANPPDSRFTYITDNLAKATDILKSNCPDLLTPTTKVKREKVERFSKKRMQW
ncbi:2119_t:CDS:2 [Paraglomus brasilianum]|uniref:2119_t:CDS:1 n=1 Tax=Paraglomus brasilianum TaxID=144538 RepID=A0A9N9BIJ1_9GLOM|nr:2119_t:CDS:2 [Paraglomus brasilianum]